MLDWSSKERAYCRLFLVVLQAQSVGAFPIMGITIRRIAALKGSSYLDHGFAARCEAVAIAPPVTCWDHLGCALGSGSALGWSAVI